MAKQRIKNNPKGLTLGMINKFIYDEQKAYKTYTELGLHEIARDEHDHYAYFVKQQDKLLSEKHPKKRDTHQCNADVCKF